MVKKIENVRIAIKEPEDKLFEVILDFDNDRHHCLHINKGESRDLVAKNLRSFADQLQNDSELDT